MCIRDRDTCPPPKSSFPLSGSWILPKATASPLKSVPNPVPTYHHVADSHITLPLLQNCHPQNLNLITCLLYTSLLDLFLHSGFDRGHINFFTVVTLCYWKIKKNFVESLLSSVPAGTYSVTGKCACLLYTSRCV